IEGWKARKGDVATEVPNTSEGSTSTASTIDVDAVSVK
ncbi:MAG: DUF1232 domain-containing protein, partial [Nostoc sp.]